jgi:hypothetical protein
MTLQEDEFNLAEEEERLKRECREKAKEAAQLDDDNLRKPRLLAEGQELDAQLSGVQWAQTAHADEDVPEWDADVDSVTLAGLNGGEMGSLEDDVGDNGGAGPGTTRVLLVAEGTVRAPYVDDSMTDAQRVGAVRELPLTYLKWAEARINEMTTVGNGDGKGFDDWLMEARAEMTSTENSS